MRKAWALAYVLMGAAACSPPSTISEGRCGDGRISAGETCDDGNAIDEDACTNACQNAPERLHRRPLW